MTNSPSKDGDVSGHADHTGPVWFEGITVEWGDIIPPFTFDGGSFPGLNWTAEGQAIYENGCNIPDPTPTPTPDPTATPDPTPTPEPTPTPGPTATPEPTPTGGVGGATGTPPGGGAGGATSDPTLPSTSTIDGQGSGPLGDGWRVILLAMAGVLGAALLLTPAKAVIRKDDSR